MNRVRQLVPTHPQPTARVGQRYITQPIQSNVVIPVTPHYTLLSQQSDFQLFLKRLVDQMGLDPEDGHVLIEKSKDEFAKCFITKNADSHFNYELYELAGDVCINAAIVLYIHRMVQHSQDIQSKRDPTFLPDARLKDYFNKLRARYISNSHYKKIAEQLGFDRFIVYGAADKPMDADAKYIPSVLEAFFGCFEFMMNRYVPSKYSHSYVASFISHVMHSNPINFHPKFLYDSVTLLKETSDQLLRNDTVRKQEDDNGVPTHRPLIGYIFKPILDRGNYVVIKEYENGSRKIIVGPSSGSPGSREQKEKVATDALALLVANQGGEYDAVQSFIRKAPTPQELGIAELCK